MVAMDAMDTSPSSPVWAQDVDVFTSPDRNTTEAARQKGLGAIVAMLNAGELQFLDLLRSMESCLVTTDDARRSSRRAAGRRGPMAGREVTEAFSNAMSLRESTRGAAQTERGPQREG